jgi:hypothetical protein
MGRLISTYYKDESDTDDYCEVKIDAKNEMFYIKYFNGLNDVLKFEEEFPGKALSYVESAAENWALGIKKLEKGQLGLL